MRSYILLSFEHWLLNLKRNKIGNLKKKSHLKLSNQGGEQSAKKSAENFAETRDKTKYGFWTF